MVTSLADQLQRERLLHRSGSAQEFDPTLLHFAAIEGDADMVSCLIAAGADLNAKDQDGCTPLFLTAKYGDNAALLHFVNADALLEIQNCQGATALWVAAKRGNAAMVESLVAAGASLDVIAHGIRGMSPLSVAAFNGSTHICEVLIKAGATVDILDGVGRTPLREACQEGNDGCVRLLLTGGSAPNAQDSLGVTALFSAAECNKLEAARLLLQHGAIVDRGGPSTEQNVCATPLRVAVEKHHGDMVRILLEHGAAPDALDALGCSVVGVVIWLGFPDLLELLIGAGANCNLVDSDGKRPLHYAFESSNELCGSHLLDAGASPDCTDLNGTPLLWTCVDRDSLRWVELLLMHGACPWFTGDKTTRPIEEASMRGHKCISHLLIKAGATYGPDTERQARRRGHAKLARWLQRRRKNHMCRCGYAANLRCSKCKKVRYCSAACQTPCWPTHKLICQ